MLIRTLAYLFAAIITLPEISMAENNLYHRYINQALQGHLSTMVTELTKAQAGLSEKEQKLIDKFNARFGPDGRVEQPEIDDPFVRDVVVAYRTYWSDVLFNEYDEQLQEQKITGAISALLEKYEIPCADSVSPLDKVAEEFEARGYRALTGKTLPHFDLLSWGSNKPADYSVALSDDTITVRVYFMSDFVSYGWSHYATFGAAYPGGWATSDALYCMADDYDTTSEKFLISYLQHEGRHFADYSIFPELQQTDLEYRAKLTELIFADTTLYDLIGKFTNNAARSETSPHALANHELISRLSHDIFGERFVDDLSLWRTVDPARIHAAAEQLLNRSTDDLMRAGADTVQGLITP